MSRCANAGADSGAAQALDRAYAMNLEALALEYIHFQGKQSIFH
jgi:hypothetical protein